MADKRLPGDTLFIVAEPDFVFYKDDETQKQEWLEAQFMESLQLKRVEELADEINDPTMKKRYLQELQRYRAREQESGLAQWTYDMSAAEEAEYSINAQGERVLWNWAGDETPNNPYRVKVFSKPNKPKPWEFQEKYISPELLDLVAYATAAARVGRGGLIWAGWNAVQWTKADGTTAKPKRSQSPSSGAQLIMVTSDFMRFILPKWQDLPDRHMGYNINGLAMSHQHTGGMCYLLPPIGGFFTHPSTTSVGLANLVSHFSAGWAQEGTRKRKPEERHRYLCSFSSQGDAQYLHTMPIDLPKDGQDLRWLTQKPPGTPECFTGWQPWHAGLEDSSSFFFYLWKTPVDIRTG